MLQNLFKGALHPDDFSGDINPSDTNRIGLLLKPLTMAQQVACAHLGQGFLVHQTGGCQAIHIIKRDDVQGNTLSLRQCGSTVKS